MKDPGSHFGIDEFPEGHGIIDDMILEIGTYKRITTSANEYSPCHNTLEDIRAKSDGPPIKCICM
jgi:hypothetical protein